MNRLFNLLVCLLLFSIPAFAESDQSPDGTQVYELKKIIELPDQTFDFFTGALVISRDISIEVFNAPVDIRSHQKKINAMAKKVEAMLPSREPELVLNAISQYLFGIEGYQPEPKDPSTLHVEHMLPSAVLNSKVGNPLGLASVYLAIADQEGIPLWGLEKKDGFYLYYLNAGKTLYVDLAHKGEISESLPDGIQKPDRVLDEQDRLSHKNILGALIRDLAVIYIGKQKFKQALDILEYAKILYPEDAEIYTLLGEIYQRQNGEGKTAGAWKEAIEKNIYYERAYVQLISAAMKVRDFTSAVSWLQKLEDHNPGGNHHGLWGIVCVMMGDFSKAAEHFEIAKKAKPDDKDNYLNAAKAYVKAGQFEKAVEAYREGSRVFPDDPRFYTAMAEEFLKHKKTGELIAYAQKALALDSKDTAAGGLLAMGYAQQGDSEKAEALLEQIMEQQPQDWRAFGIYGDFLMDKKEYKNARKFYQKAVKRNPKEPGLRYQIGLSHYYEKDPMSAQFEFEKGLKEFTGKNQALFHLGLALTDAYRQKFENAIGHYEIAKQSGFSNTGLEERFARYRATGK